MGCYSCTIKRETHFYRQKQGYPHDYRTTLILQTKIRKNTLCTRVYSGSGTGKPFITLTHSRCPLTSNHRILLHLCCLLAFSGSLSQCNVLLSPVNTLSSPFNAPSAPFSALSWSHGLLVYAALLSVC